MRTVPVGAAETLLAGRPDLLAVCAGAGVRVGVRAEVDLGALPASLAGVLGDYYDQCAELWSTLEAGTGTGAYVLVSRLVAEHRQVTGARGRADLGEVFDDAAACTELAGALRLVTEAAPPAGADLRRAMDAVGAVGEADEAGVLVAVLTLIGSRSWPATLGGVAGPGEVGRTVTLTGRVASWRDRRVRRLAGVCVHVQELWADTSGYAAALDALAV